ncbi:MAG: molybdenum cofactor guanylyltransferase [Lawsonibacter sp.]|jgi:molybdopterin-guanine dinucleotide biosynthesis protein A
MRMTIGAALLAGGKSRRMGTDKARLEMKGESFLQRIAQELTGFEERILSVDCAERYPELEWTRAIDEIPSCGPLGGLYTVLKMCRSQALLVVSCDVPLYRAAFGYWLCEQLEEPWDAVVPVTQDGAHPLCGVYRKRCAPVLERQILDGNYRIQGGLERLQTRFVEAGSWEGVLRNINTPEEYKKLIEFK